MNSFRKMVLTKAGPYVYEIFPVPYSNLTELARKVRHKTNTLESCVLTGKSSHTMFFYPEVGLVLFYTMDGKEYAGRGICLDDAGKIDVLKEKQHSDGQVFYISPRPIDNPGGVYTFFTKELLEQWEEMLKKKQLELGFENPVKRV